MAKTLKADEEEKTVGPLDVVSTKRWIDDVLRHKTTAREYTGMAGQATSQAIEALGVDKAAFTFVAGIMRKEPARRTNIVEDIDRLFTALGLWEEETLFGTPAEQASAKPALKPAANDEVDPFDAAAPEPPAPPADKPKKGKGVTGADLQKQVEAAGMH